MIYKKASESFLNHEPLITLQTPMAHEALGIAGNKYDTAKFTLYNVDW